ncbi:MAG TPA: hypothetical protein VEC12_09485, partial [Bacteroidia bacterium]|nr:hypothetical protein [Bacteroidia bacterium]
VAYQVDSVLKSITVKDITGETFIYYPLTNYKRNMLGRDMASTDDAEYNLLLYDDRYQIFETNVSPEVEQDAQYINIVPTEYRLSTEINYFYGETAPGTIILPEDTTVLVPEPDTAIEKDEDLTRFYFQTDYPPDYILNRRSRKNQSETPGIGSRGQFFTAIFPDYYVSQLDNSIINTYYHLNTNGNGPSIFANGNIVFQVKTSLSDLLGNHRVQAGVRFPFSLSGSDYFIEYQNRVNKINWNVEFFRQSRRNDGPVVNRQYINQLNAGIKLPFNEIVSLRLSAIGRQDRSRIMGIDTVSLQAPDVFYNWAGTKAELVYDNTRNIDINLPFGSRFKLFAELFQDVNVTSRQVINLGIDYRKYIKLHNKIIWATRFSANTSVGSSKVQYYMGGVENWIGPSFDGTVSRGEGSQYIFQSQANSLRGFKQNVRNGTSYALINTEIRFPVAAYVTQKPVKADYLRNFLLVPFFDVGTAWYGSSPFLEQPYNTRIIPGPGYTVTLTSADSPIVASAGIGARTRILGYYLRTDFAWGFKDGRLTDNMIQFALGYDF